MIFSKLFKKKKWLSEKVSERIAAVAELDLSQTENKAILHELAFNDGEEQVRRATLEKLADFSLWWQTLKNDPSDNLKKIAERYIVEALTGKRDLKLDDKLKKAFIQECNKTHLLEKVLFSLNDEALILQTVQRLNKDSVTYDAFNSSELSKAAKLTLLEAVNSVEELKRLLKKASSDLHQDVQNKIQVLTELAEKPILVEKSAKLVLAKLNALKDKSDYEYIDAQVNELSKEWQALEIALLNEETRLEFHAKFDAILTSLQNITAPLKQAWQQQQAELELQAKHQHDVMQAEQALKAIEADVTMALDNDTELDTAKISQSIDQFMHSLNDMQLNKQDIAEFKTKAESLFNRASQVPQIKQAINTAKTILQDLNQLVIPEELKDYGQAREAFWQLKKAWQNNESAIDIALPSSLNNEYSEIVEKWQTGTAEFEKNQRHLFAQTKRKISELEHLIKIGKFKSAFGLHKKLTHWREELNDYQLEKIEKQWTQVEEEIVKLQELQSSIANPKKMELIEEAKQLAEAPLIDPTEQAHRVRMLRKNWQSVGFTHSEQEDELKTQFNELCEQAFAPCREHYQAEEKQREDNLKAKLLLLEQLESMANMLATQQVSDWKELESVYVKLTKLWHETGLVDKDKVEDVNTRFRAATSPIKKAIATYHSENEVSKKQLIEQASKIAESDSTLEQKTEQLKHLQHQWKSVGFAGRNVDQKLWNQFRAVNNPVFDQREEVKTQQMAKSNEVFEKCKSELESLHAQVAGTSELSVLKNISAQIKDVLKANTDLSKGQYAKLSKQQSNIENDIEKHITQLTDQKQNQAYLQLFEAVTKLANGEVAELSELKPAWQSAINQTSKQDRNELTIKIEITAGIESPSDMQSLRNDIQMQLLSDKLENGTVWHLSELLEHWLAAGHFDQESISQLERIKSAFVK